jgi:hypothetical protein
MHMRYCSKTARSGTGWSRQGSKAGKGTLGTPTCVGSMLDLDEARHGLQGRVIYI